MAGAVDCDIHPAVPNIKALLPYLDGHWREQVTVRGIDASIPPVSPLDVPANALPGSRRDGVSRAPISELMRDQALEPFGTRFAILNCLYGASSVHNVDLAARFRARHQRLARGGMADPGAAVASVDRRVCTEYRTGG